MLKRQALMIFAGVLLAAQASAPGSLRAQNVTVDAALLQQLQEVIQQQQQQIQRQQQRIEMQSDQLRSQSDVLSSLQKQVQDLQETASNAESQAIEAKSTAQQAVDTAKKAEAVAPAGSSDDKVVTSGQERIKLAISGQINRAVNTIGDGKNTRVYFVDNDASNTRFRFVGTGKVTDDFTIGSRLEVALTSNESSDVSQDNEDPDDFLDVRWAEVSFDSKSLGKLSLGQGDTASNNSAEVDLSRTDVVQYSSIADIAGGIQFRDNDDSLTGISISDAFQNLDGLSRRDRLRYDTPSFYGFRLAGSAVSDQRWDTSIWWGGEGYGLKAGAAAAVSDPNTDEADLRYSGSTSILHEETGLNFTLAGGLEDRDDGGDRTNLYAKGGWIGDFFSFGNTAFGLDYTYSNNFPTNTDDGYSVGAAVVQSIGDYGTEIYAQYRVYSLDRDGSPGVQDIHVGTIGTRVKF